MTDAHPSASARTSLGTSHAVEWAKSWLHSSLVQLSLVLKSIRELPPPRPAAAAVPLARHTLGGAGRGTRLSPPLPPARLPATRRRRQL
jgi:hypothetical protein